MVNGVAFAVDKDWNQVLIDIEGNVVVKDVFDCASEFSEGFMSISTKNDSGYINNKGEFIIHCSFEPNFHEFYPPGINYPFREGVAVPQVDYKVYKMYDNKGKEIMSETKFNYCSYCSDGLILCQKEENGKFMSIDDLKIRSKVGNSVVELLKKMGCLEGMSQSNQISLFG